MKIVFRADASERIGAGHVVRCQTLAETLRSRGGTASFLCRHLPGQIEQILRKDGFAVTRLAGAGSHGAGDGGYSHWLGVSEAQDAEDTSAALASESPDWIVVDHYALSAAWEHTVARTGTKVLALDDLGRSHYADLLLDQNFSLDPEARYAGKLRAGCRALLGPKFALLQSEYARLAATPSTKDQVIRRIFVFFGGADPSGMTLRTLRALAGSGSAIDVVVGPMNRQAAAIAAFAQRDPNVAIHAGRASLADLLNGADAAVGAGGGNTWERCCLGVPSLVVSIADNQVAASRDLDAAGIVRYLGTDRSVGEAQIDQAMRELASRPTLRASMSEQCRLLVDGHGARRAAELMLPTTVEALRMRPAVAADREFYFHLVNDPDVRRQSFNDAPIAWDNHKRWFDSKMANPGTSMFVLQAGGLAVGQVRIDCAGDTAFIDYSLDPLVRGRGWGRILVRTALHMAKLPRTSHIVAEVKEGNAASRAVFEKLGFACRTVGDKVVYEMGSAAISAGGLPFPIAGR